MMKRNILAEKLSLCFEVDCFSVSLCTDAEKILFKCEECVCACPVGNIPPKINISVEY
jgi:hypothetical protein